jgi:hypothetical protein
VVHEAALRREAAFKFGMAEFGVAPIAQPWHLRGRRARRVRRDRADRRLGARDGGQPRDYYTHMLGAGSLLGDLARNGTVISRTRMVEPGCALVGDFAVAAQLLDAGRSVIKVAEPPEGTFAAPGVAVCAEIYEGVAVHLPTHFFHVMPA